MIRRAPLTAVATTLLLLGVWTAACGGAPAGPTSATDVPLRLTSTTFLPTDVPLPATGTPPSSTGNSASEGSVDLQVILPEGDPLLGELTALSLRCFGCHVGAGQLEGEGPPFTSTDELSPIMSRGELRIGDPNYTGQATTNWEYVLESIIRPDMFVVPGEWTGRTEMPTDYTTRMTETDLADIMAWLGTFE